MDDMTFLIGLDLGTTMLKGVLLHSDGAIISREKTAMEYSRGDAGSVEFDAEKFYIKIAGMIRELTRKLPEGGQIAGLSMASASGNTVLVDRNGVPIRPVFSWLDSRDRGETRRIFGEAGEREKEIVGWDVSSSFPIAHLSWLKEHSPEAIERAEYICLSTDYVNYRLTGKWGIDTSTATTFLLQEQETSSWHVPFLERLDIPEEKLPPIYSCGTVLGTVTEQASKETGLKAGTPIVLGAFDHPCAARGTGVIKQGQLMLSCGTSWVGFYPLEDRKKAIRLGMIVDPFLYKEGLWGAMFSLPNISERINSYICRYISSGADRYRLFDKLSSLSGPGASGLRINLQDTYDDRIDRYSKEDVARAIMESPVYLLRDQIKRLADNGIVAENIVMVGGPSETYPWPQIISDILDMPLTVVNGSCAGAVGAALLAATGVGIYASLSEALLKVTFTKHIFKPQKENVVDV